MNDLISIKNANDLKAFVKKNDMTSITGGDLNGGVYNGGFFTKSFEPLCEHGRYVYLINLWFLRNDYARCKKPSYSFFVGSESEDLDVTIKKIIDFLGLE